jgi:tetratricopeptide (TPR) repeat protein
MRRMVPRAFLTAALVATVAGCASGGGGGVGLGGDTGGRYLVLIPDLQGPSGDRVAAELRTLVTGMATHAAISQGAVREKMAEYDIETLDEISARQLAQVIEAQLVSWGTVQQTGAGLQADVKFVDSRSGDEIALEAVEGASAPELAGAIFSAFQESVEGIRQASFCNDYLSSSQYDQALETCERALAIVPGSTSALYGKATALLYLEREAEALEFYDRLLEIDATHQDALLGAGLAASRLDDSDQAMVYYNRYLEVNPGNVQVRMAVTNDIAQTGDYLSAFRVLETAIAENEADTDFQRYLFSIATAAGQGAMEAGDSATAREVFASALSAYQKGFAEGEAPDASQVRQAIAVNTALGRTEDAIRIAREGTQQFPDDAAVWSQLATTLAGAGQHAEAIAALDRVIAIDPAYENAYIRRAQAKLQTGQRQQAIADLRLAARDGDSQTVATVLYGLGAQAIQASNWPDAATTLQTAHEFASGTLRSDIAFYWGYAVYKQGEAIARANGQGDAGQARRALEFFQTAVPILQGSQHAQAAEVLGGARQYIDNQEAIIQASQQAG